MTEADTGRSRAVARPGVLPPLGASLFIALLAFLAIEQLQPPAVIPAGAPSTEFSAARALEHLKVIAQKPHPTGSAENTVVRDYLAGQLKSLGLNPQIQTATVARYEPRWRAGIASAATANNLVVRLLGTRATLAGRAGRAVMLAAHYDSVATGPGASDDGSGVATLLETARALKAGPPLSNDVIFLFTDGEELGLLGAKAFVQEHPWAKDVAVALNFEARGACGPVYMFETSARNGWLISQLAQAAPDPVTSSLMYDFYQRLPNDTDFSVFKRAGMAGLNFAYVGCWPRYHTLRDDVQDLAPRSLQHHGSYALALARRFGNLDLAQTASDDALYFSLFRLVFHYPKSWAAPLTILVLIFYAGVVVLGLRRRRLTPRGMAFGFLGWTAGAAGAAGAFQLIWLALRDTRFVTLLPYGMSYNGDLYALGFMALTVAVLSGVYARLGPRNRVEDLTAGALVWWAVLAVLSSVYFSGGSYLFAWPLLAASLELAYAFGQSGAPSEAARVLAWTLPAFAGMMLFAPLPYELLELVRSSALSLILVAVALLAGFLVPLFHILIVHWRWWPARVSAAVAAAFIGAAMAASHYDAAHPRADTILYALNADTGKAVWASADSAPDAWTSQFLAGHTRKASLGALPYSSALTLEADAPAASLMPPQITVLDDVTLGEIRVLRLHVASPRGASQIWLRLHSGRVLEADLNGKKLSNTGDAAGAEGWGIIYSGTPEQGLVLTLKVPASQTPTLTVVDISGTLPEFPGLTILPRPPDLMPSPALRFDSCTLVSKTFRPDLGMRMMSHH